MNLTKQTSTPATATIHLRRPWTSAFFRHALGTVGFSPRLKNSGHVITFLRRCGLQNTDRVMTFWLFSCLCQSPVEGKMSFVQFKIFSGDNFERCKMHRMKKERFQLITYQETIDYQLECMLLQFKLYMLERELAGKATMCFTSAARIRS